jgi:hypothetical protein
VARGALDFDEIARLESLDASGVEPDGKELETRECRHFSNDTRGENPNADRPLGVCL